MKKFLGGALLFAFLACVGIETFHHHAQRDPQNCPLCLVKAQAKSKHPSIKTSSVVREVTQYDLPFESTTLVYFSITIELPARSPPIA